MADDSRRRRLQWRPLSDVLLTTVAAVVLGIVCVIELLIRVARQGWSAVFYVQPRHDKPQVLDMYGTHQFITLQESRVKLHYVECGERDKPLMVLSHGFPEIWYSWRHQLQHFSTDFRVVAYDLRGYGESESSTDVSDYTVDQMASDLDQLITGLGYERAVIIGHDWGGAAAWSLAAIYPHRVEKLIIINAPHPGPFFDYMRRTPSQVLKLRHMLLFQLPVLPRVLLRASDFKWPADCFVDKPFGAKPGTFTADDIDAYKYYFFKYGDWSACFQMFHAGLRYINPRLESAVKLGKISVPTLIIWGTDDQALELQLADLSAKYVDQCTVKYVDGASHWVQQEEPQTVNRLIRQFLDEVA